MFQGALPLTVIPILRAVPATIFMAESTVKAFKSVILSLAITSTCSQVTLATFLRFDSADPLFNPVVSNNWIATGGVLMIKSNDLSVYTVITTGSTLPALSWIRE